MLFFVILFLAFFFALNMGGASFAAAFSTSYGGKIINQNRAALLFLGFVILGAVLFGANVSKTLGENIISVDSLSSKAILIILLSAGLSMFISNIMHIPQSTSLVTVASIAGVGAYYNAINFETFKYLVPFWLALPLLSFVITWLVGSYIYPPRRINFWIYERYVNHEKKLKCFVLFTSIYCAFSVGTNNVANVVGPIMNNMDFSMHTLLLGFACVYGLGAFLFSGTLKMVSNKIVPLGLLTASIISLVSGTLMIVASIYGVPQSFVMLQLGAIFAIASIKHGHELTFQDKMFRKTLYTWTINPLITFFVAWGLSVIIL